MAFGDLRDDLISAFDAAKHGAGKLTHAALRHLSGLQRIPRHEADALPIAIVDRRLPRTVDNVVTILHRDDRKEFLRALDLFHTHFRKADVPNLAFALRALKKTKLFFLRHVGIDSMKLKKIDALEPQPAEAAIE